MNAIDRLASGNLMHCLSSLVLLHLVAHDTIAGSVWAKLPSHVPLLQSMFFPSYSFLHLSAASLSPSKHYNVLAKVYKEG